MNKPNPSRKCLLQGELLANMTGHYRRRHLQAAYLPPQVEVRKLAPTSAPRKMIMTIVHPTRSSRARTRQTILGKCMWTVVQAPTVGHGQRRSAHQGLLSACVGRWRRTGRLAGIRLLERERNRQMAHTSRWSQKHLPSTRRISQRRHRLLENEKVIFLLFFVDHALNIAQKIPTTSTFHSTMAVRTIRGVRQANMPRSGCAQSHQRRRDASFMQSETLA